MEVGLRVTEVLVDGAGTRVMAVRPTLKMHVYNLVAEGGTLRWFCHGTSVWDLVVTGPAELRPGEASTSGGVSSSVVIAAGSEVEWRAEQRVADVRQGSPTGGMVWGYPSQHGRGA